ncbi:uncharacterized protein MELLADRAFT_101012 [Melampsora larici-populina 98AG31]|uniref:F-box domain-containing protein n=1 Tax=Melampsora larici-populina (strain 98AG31 / pathotype 3-4-7) TaxID=747676 RepID=F4R3B8_MELLP|nr:uncharacterized protein MELLADRAFT_101012 [Melampsora larici-populina 98AG31]EGG13196.1 hypothetical protein MELLADRAFT_101012 [Melampsora larici-populina 98AG31]
MLDKLPREIQEEIIYYLIELDREGHNNFIFPYTGKSRSAQSLAALSQVSWNVRSVCESFLWKTLVFSRPQRPNELEAISEIAARIRHIRSLQARVSLSNSSLAHNGVIDHRCLDYFSDLRDFLTDLSESQCSLKHIRLQTLCDIEINRLMWLEHTNNILFKQLKVAHREVTYAVFNFPLLTSLDISGACYAFVPEDDIAQCIRQLPHLVRFRAHNSVAPYHLNSPRRLMLGRALARLRSLEELSLQNLDTPDQSWCDLEWNSSLKVLSIKRCLGLTGEALYEFILKFPTITDIRLNKEAWPGLKSLVFSSVPPGNETRMWLENWALGRLVRIKFHGTQPTPLPGIADHESEDEDENQMEPDPQNQNHVETEDTQLDVQTSLSNPDNNGNTEAQIGPSEIEGAVADVNSSDLGEDHSSEGDYFVEEEFDEYADLYDGFPSPEDHGFLSQIEAAEADAAQLEAAAIQAEPAGEPEEFNSDSDSDETGTNVSSQDPIEENADNDDALSVPGSHCSELEELEDWTSSTWIRDHE